MLTPGKVSRFWLDNRTTYFFSNETCSLSFEKIRSSLQFAKPQFRMLARHQRRIVCRRSGSRQQNQRHNPLPGLGFSCGAGRQTAPTSSIIHQRRASGRFSTFLLQLRRYLCHENVTVVIFSTGVNPEELDDDIAYNAGVGDL